MNLVVLVQTVRALLSRSTWKIWPLTSHLSRSLEVIGTDMDRSLYDFLLTFHRNHGPISYRLQDKPWFQLWITKFFHPLLKGFALRLGIGTWGQKLEWLMGLLGWERSLTISLAIWIEKYMNVMDRRTDRHWATAKTALMHSVMW